MYAQWLGGWRARRETRRRNIAFLQRVADAVAQEYEALPYAMLSDPKRLRGSCESIVNGVWIAWNFEFQKSRSGDIYVTLDFESDLPTPWGVKPSRAFNRAPEALDAPPRQTRWVIEIPAIALDGS